MDRIVNNLWLGSQRDADELVGHNPENITAILNVRGPDAYRPPGCDQSAEHPGKAYKWIPAPDIQRVSSEHVREAVAWLQEQTKRNERILIHCMYGISRSPAFLAAFLVTSRISRNMDEAKALIASHRDVIPATQAVLEADKPAVVISALSGLPNRQAFEQGQASAFVAVVEIDFMKMFMDSYGRIAGDLLIRRLAKILLATGLDAYYDDDGERFLCKGNSAAELVSKLSFARRSLGQPSEVYAAGRLQLIEELDCSFGVGATLETAEASLRKTQKAKAPNGSPEWLRKLVASAGPGQGW